MFKHLKARKVFLFFTSFFFLSLCWLLPHLHNSHLLYLHSHLPIVVLSALFVNCLYCYLFIVTCPGALERRYINKTYYYIINRRCWDYGNLKSSWWLKKKKKSSRTKLSRTKANCTDLFSNRVLRDCWKRSCSGRGFSRSSSVCLQGQAWGWGYYMAALLNLVLKHLEGTKTHAKLYTLIFHLLLIRFNLTL